MGCIIYPACWSIDGPRPLPQEGQLPTFRPDCRASLCDAHFVGGMVQRAAIQSRRCGAEEHDGGGTVLIVLRREAPRAAGD